MSCGPAESGSGTTVEPPLEGTAGDEWNKEMGMERGGEGMAHTAFGTTSSVSRNAASELQGWAAPRVLILISLKIQQIGFLCK